MVWLSKRSKDNFYDTLKILKNKKTMHFVYAELKKYIENTFGITVFNITIDKFGFFDRPKKNSYFYQKKYLLVIHVSSYSEREMMQNKVSVELANYQNAYKMVNDKIKQDLIIDKLIELAKLNNFKTKINKTNTYVDYRFGFTTDYAEILLDKIEKGITKEILNEFKEKAHLWRIEKMFSTVTIFYFTELDKIENEKNGITHIIRDRYLSRIKEIDSINLFKEEYIVFDTKENVDKNYSGNLFYYFR